MLGLYQFRPHALAWQHAELMNTLDYAVGLPGETGEAARELEKLIKPHVEKEENGVMLLLSKVEEISHGHWPGNAQELLAAGRRLEAELQPMLKEHDQILITLKRLQKAADRAGDEDVSRFCDELALHAKLEEEILYPAAVLVGKYLRILDSARESATADSD